MASKEGEKTQTFSCFHYYRKMAALSDDALLARSLTSFVCLYFVMYLSLGLIKVNQRLAASDDTCERPIVVFRELFQQLFGNSYPSKALLFCKEIRCSSGTYPSHFKIMYEN
jgi:hypothetical protein